MAEAEAEAAPTVAPMAGVLVEGEVVGLAMATEAEQVAYGVG